MIPQWALLGFLGVRNLVLRINVFRGWGAAAPIFEIRVILRSPYFAYISITPPFGGTWKNAPCNIGSRRFSRGRYAAKVSYLIGCFVPIF